MPVDPTEATATKVIAGFAASLSYDGIPEQTRHTVKWIILDSLGTALAATTLGEGCREVVAVARHVGGAMPESSILGTGIKVSAPNAAFANGALVHALNYDPIGAKIGHIGVTCLSAPLALAEAIGRTHGRDLITAATVACEVSARVTAAISRTGRRPSEMFLSGQILGHFGAAAGAARMLGLGADGMESALGLALMQMNGSRQVVLSGDPPAKAIYGAFPNQTGVMAALLAKEGLGAQYDVFGPPAGLYAAIYGGDCDAGALVDGLGTSFLLEEAEFKPWPSSNQVHPFIEAALALAGKSETADIASVNVVCHSRFKPWCEPAELRRRPTNAAAAADSVPFCVAAALTDGDVTLATFSPEQLGRPELLALASRVEVLFDDVAKGATVSVGTKRGDNLSSRVDAPLGSLSRPISDAQLQSKFRDCCRRSVTALSEDQITDLIELVFDLENVRDVADLTSLACGRYP